jgi:hemerythrin-like domain-containing protein
MIARRFTGPIRPAITTVLLSPHHHHWIAKTSTLSTVGQTSYGPLSDRIIHDHEELHHVYDKMTSTTDNAIKHEYQNRFVWELARHAVAEELVLYPALEKAIVPGGKEMAEKDYEVTLIIKKDLYDFQGLKASDPAFEPTIKKLYTHLKEHILEEERDDLPKLEQAISRDESARLARSFERTKMFVPTRSHPSAPNKPVS